MNNIKLLPLQDRPRERMREFGSEALSNEELLTILIGSGNKYRSAKELSVAILSLVNNINELPMITYERLATIKGLGPTKIANVMAAIVLSKRIKKINNSIFDLKITNSKIIYDYFKDKFHDEMQECFYAVYLDASKKIISIKLLFKGTLDRSLVHPREIFKEAYLLCSSSIICIHNHPSGNVEPSKADKILTSQLLEIGNLHGIPIIDHLIIGKDKYYSFFENGDI